MGDRLVRWGLPRAANAVPYLMGFITAAVATVLVTRSLLALAGYPQLGGGGLHVAHVLWGGLLLGLGVMLLLSFNGSTVRPVGAFVAGVGFGLFIDEVGKFVTSDNDYFFSPAVAIMYVTIVLFVLAVQGLHGRTPLTPGELYVAALHSAAAGVARGLNDRDRHVALRRLEAAGDQPGVPEAVALVHALPAGTGDRLGRWHSRAAHRVRAILESRLSQRIAIGILLVQTIATIALLALVALFVGARAVGRDATLDLNTATLISTGTAALSAVCAAVGVRRLVQRRRTDAFRWMQRAVLIDLLLTRVLLLIADQFAIVPSVLIDLYLLGTFELGLRKAARDEYDTRRPTGAAARP